MGMEMIGKKTPHRKIIGKRKKLERVIASKASRTPTEIKMPKKAKAKQEIIREANREKGWDTRKPKTKTIKTKAISAITNPKAAAPNPLPNRSVLRWMGAMSKRSRASIRFSKLITMAAMEVVEKSIVIPTKPGLTSEISCGFLS
jgi:hypothetical protein